MTPRSRPRRPGFTLVEVLVVMAIIAIMVSLLVAGTMKVKGVSERTENINRMKKIDAALSGLRGELNLDYIPSTGFRLKASYDPVADPLEYGILKRAWPNLNMGDTGFAPPGATVTLDGNQTITFFLTGGTVTNYQGWGRNPKDPARSLGASNKGPWVEVTPGKHVDANGRLIDAWGNPYAYFAPVNRTTGDYTVNGTPQTFNGGRAGPTSPWQNSPGEFVNKKGFQITSAGADGVFGAGGVLPGVGSPGGDDDMANFSEFVLGGAR